MKKLILICLSTLTIFVTSSCGTSQPNVQKLNESKNSIVDNQNDQVEKKEEVKGVSDIKPPVEIQLTAVGDILIHAAQLRAHYNKNTNKYDFHNDFKFVKSYIEKADFAITNIETTFGGEETKFTGYPTFNSPDELADALKNTGFDGISTASNHILDRGEIGFFRTLNVLKEKNFINLGSRADEKVPAFSVVDIKGIKVGMTAFVYETPTQGNHKTLNAIPIPKSMTNLINTFDYNNLEAEYLEMKSIINKMKDQKCDVILFEMHWGEEYQRQPNRYQKEIAQKLSDFGVDIIFASHPHVLQPIEFVKSSVSGKDTLVAYSMGNFVSNQRYELLPNQKRYTEDGLIVNARIRKDFEKEQTTIVEASYIPTWVNLYKENGKDIYEIVPLNDALLNPEAYNLKDKQTIWRANNSKNNTVSLMKQDTDKLHIESPQENK